MFKPSFLACLMAIMLPESRTESRAGGELCRSCLEATGPFVVVLRSKRIFLTGKRDSSVCQPNNPIATQPTFEHNLSRKPCTVESKLTEDLPPFRSKIGRRIL
jgi:hypothetical protein